MVIMGFKAVSVVDVLCNPLAVDKVIGAISGKSPGYIVNDFFVENIPLAQ